MSVWAPHDRLIRLDLGGRLGALFSPLCWATTERTDRRRQIASKQGHPEAASLRQRLALDASRPPVLDVDSPLPAPVCVLLTNHPSANWSATATAQLTSPPTPSFQPAATSPAVSCDDHPSVLPPPAEPLPTRHLPDQNLRLYTVGIQGESVWPACQRRDDAAALRRARAWRETSGQTSAEGAGGQ